MNRETGRREERSRRLTEMSVERVEKADGRYLLYYAWAAPQLLEAHAGTQPDAEPKTEPEGEASDV